MLKIGEFAHYPPCCPGSKNLFGKWSFWSTKVGIDEGQYVEIINDAPIFAVSCYFSYKVLGDMLRQNGEFAHYPRES